MLLYLSSLVRIERYPITVEKLWVVPSTCPTRLPTQTCGLDYLKPFKIKFTLPITAIFRSVSHQ